MPNLTLKTFTDPRALRVFFLIGVMLLITLIYWPAIHGPFALDDSINIPQTNSPIKSLSDLIDISFGNNSGLLGRPIPVATFALNHHFWGTDTTSFKVTNLVIHLANSLLVFLLVKFLLLAISVTHTQARTYNLNSIALATGLLWAIHPLQVSTVMYAVQRMTLLMTLFSLAALVLYLIARLRLLENRPGASTAFGGALVCTVLACFCKENGALIPIYCLILEICVLRFRLKTDALSKLYKYTWIAVSVATTIATAAYLVSAPEFLAGGYKLRDFSMVERLSTQAVVVAHYLTLFVLPDISNMSLFHDDFPVSRKFGSKEFLSTFLLVALAVVSWRARFRAPLVATGILIFLASHLMESTILPLEIAFEHRNYIGTIGLALSIVCLVSLLVARIKFQNTGYALLFTATCLLSFQTTIRASEWKNDMTFATASVLKKPESVRARTALATALMERGKTAEALQTLDNFSALQPDNPLTELMAYYIEGALGRNNHSRADRIESLLANKPVSNNVVTALGNLSTQFERMEKANPIRNQILKFYTTASQNDSLQISIRYQAVMHARHSRLLTIDGQRARALEAIKHAASLNKTNSEIQLRLAESMADNQNWTEAGQILETLKQKICSQNNDFEIRFTRLQNQLERVLLNWSENVNAAAQTQQ